MLADARDNCFLCSLAQIISGGNIVYADELAVQNGATSKTFAVALSRDMQPTARIVAYYVRSDGEVVSDSLTFFVNGSKDREVPTPMCSYKLLLLTYLRRILNARLSAIQSTVYIRIIVCFFLCSSNACFSLYRFR